MTRRRVLLWILLVFLAVIALVTVSANFLINQYRDQLALVLSDILERTVMIEGEVIFIPSLTPTLIVGDIRIENPAWASRKNAISAKSLSVSIALKPLLNQRVDITDVTLQGGDLLLEQGKDGLNNWTLFASDSVEDHDAEAESDSGSNWVFAGIRTIAIEESIVAFQRDSSSQYSVELEQVDAVVFADQPMEIDIKGRYNDEPFTLGARGGTFTELIAKNEDGFPVAGDLHLGDTQLKVDGALGKPLVENVTFHSNLVGQNTTSLAHLFDVTIPASGPYSVAADVSIQSAGYRIDKVSGHITHIEGIKKFEIDEGSLVLVDVRPVEAVVKGKLSEQSYTIEFNGGTFEELLAQSRSWPVNLSVKAGEITLKSYGAVGLSTDDLTSEITMTLHGKSLTGFEPWIPKEVHSLAPVFLHSKIKTSASQIMLTGIEARSGKSDLGGALTVHLSEKPLRVAGNLFSNVIDIKPVINAPTATPIKNKKSRNPLDQPLTFQLPNNIDGDIDLAIKNLRGMKFPLRNIDGKLKLSQLKLSATPLKVSVPGARIVINGSVLTKDKQIESKVKVTSGRISIHKLLAGLKIESQASGLINNFTGELDGAGSTLSELIQKSKIRLAAGKSLIYLTDTDSKQPYKLPLNSSVISSNPGKPVKVSTQGSYDTVPFSISGTTATLGDILPMNRMIPVSIKADIAESELLVNGKLRLPLQNKRLDLRYKLSGKNLYDFQPLLNREIPFHGDYDIKGTIKLDGKLLAFPEFIANVEKTRVNGNLTIDATAPMRTIDGSIQMSQLSLDMLGGNEKDKVEASAAETEEAGIPNIDIPVIELQSTKLSFLVDINKVIKNEQDIGKLKLQASIKKGVLSIEPAYLQLSAGGEIKSKFRLDSSTAIPVLSMSLDSTDINYGVLLRQLGISDMAEGKFVAKMKLDGTGASLLALVNDMKGKVEVIGGPGKLRDQDLRVTLNVSNVIGTMLPTFFKKSEDLIIECFVTRWNFENGYAYTDATLFETRRVNVALSGVVHLADREMDLLIFPKASDKSLMDVAVPVRVTGNMSKPGISPGALPGISVLGLVNINLNHPTDLTGIITPVDKLFGKGGDIPPDVNKCVATIEYRDAQKGKKGGGPIRNFFRSIGESLSDTESVPD